jgi:hypothetical protein
VSAALQSAEPPSPPYEVGDFGEWSYEDGDKKYRLTFCPLCELDPERSSHLFSERDHSGTRRAAHFFEAHDADDVGRPLAELVGSGTTPTKAVPLPRRGTRKGAEHYARAKAATRDRAQAGLDGFGGTDGD